MKNLLKFFQKNQKTIKIYLIPLATIFLSILPWWAFAKYILKFNFIAFLSTSTNSSNKSVLIFLLVFISAVYIGWVFLNMWVENSKSIGEKEKKIERFFLVYGKSFAGIVFGQFLFIILVIIIG